MANKTTNAHLIVTVIVLAFLVYFGKIFFWPTEKDEARKRIATLAQIASFQTIPSVVQAQSKHNALNYALADNFEADISDYLETTTGQVQTEFNKTDLESLSALYVKYIMQIQITSRDVKEIRKRSYQAVIVAKGKTYSESFNDAYLIEVNFDKEWKLVKLKVLAPPATDEKVPTAHQ